jgi:hypothetical protein
MLRLSKLFGGERWGHPMSEKRSAAHRKSDEDVAAGRIIKASLEAIESGREILLPAHVAERMGRGENSLKIIREWRSLSLEALSRATGIEESALVDFESGRERLSAATIGILATTLRVPTAILATD